MERRQIRVSGLTRLSEYRNEIHSWVFVVFWCLVESDFSLFRSIIKSRSISIVLVQENIRRTQYLFCRQFHRVERNTGYNRKNMKFLQWDDIVIVIHSVWTSVKSRNLTIAKIDKFVQMARCLFEICECEGSWPIPCKVSAESALMHDYIWIYVSINVITWAATHLKCLHS